MKRSRTDAKSAWKALKKDPTSSALEVSAAKAAYKRLKRSPSPPVVEHLNAGCGGGHRWPLTTATLRIDGADSFAGSLLLKTKKGKWQARFFLAHGGYLLYSRKKGGKVAGGIDLAGSQSSVIAGHDSLRVTGLDGDANNLDVGGTRELRTVDLRFNDGATVAVAPYPSLYEWHCALQALMAPLGGAEPTPQSPRSSKTEHAEKDGARGGTPSVAPVPAARDNTGPALSAAARAFFTENEIVVHQVSFFMYKETSESPANPDIRISCSLTLL